jgi:hypothetical protein
MIARAAARRLRIYYRHVGSKGNAISRDPKKSRPKWFSHEACLRNLIYTIAQDPQAPRVSLTIMFDGTFEELAVDFAARYIVEAPIPITLQLLTAGSDRFSSMITLSHAHTTAMPENELIYFLENDYLHQSGWVSKVFELFDSGLKVDIVSLYDHGDKYIAQMYPGLQTTLLASSNHHWRTVPSTCGSYILEKAAFDRDWDMFARWLDDYHFFGLYVNQMGRTLLSPVPGLATHAMTGYLSPAVAWEQFVV